MNLEVVSYDRDHTSEASVKDSLRTNIRNPVKTPPVLQAEILLRLHLFSKSLPGVLEDVEIPDEPGGGVV